MAEFHVIPDPTTQRLDNSWVSPKNPLGESAYARVGNLLQQVHATNMQILSNGIVIKSILLDLDKILRYNYKRNK